MYDYVLVLATDRRGRLAVARNAVRLHHHQQMIGGGLGDGDKRKAPTTTTKYPYTDQRRSGSAQSLKEVVYIFVPLFITKRLTLPKGTTNETKNITLVRRGSIANANCKGQGRAWAVHRNKLYE